MMPAAFAPFVEQAPFCVMTRLALEALFRAERLDQLFRDTAQRQYHKELLFSQLVELMLAVVLRVEPTVHAAYQKRADVLPVSDQAVYDKLQCLELDVSAALVADSADQIAPVMRALKARLPAWLPGYRARVIDGNHLSATQRRLRELRHTWAAALPGKVLAVYDPQYDLVTQVFLTPDGHAQERALLEAVLPSVQAKDLWIADRNFCTLAFLFGIVAAKAAFVIRQHGTLVGRLVGKRRRCGRTATGKVYEQRLELVCGENKQVFRRITVVLDVPTRDGDTEIHVLTNLPQRVTAARVAELYRRRWTIEGRFYEVTQTLDCEPNTLGYPKAALFAFCLALVASNAVALLKASLRAAHGAEAVAELSAYYLTLEVRQTYVGMMVALPPPCWAAFAALSAVELAKVLRELARQVRPERYRKARRGPKKPPTPKGRYQNGGHVSTHKLIQQRQQRQQ
jgi:IS4 transposase